MIARECDRCKKLFKPQENFKGRKFVFDDIIVRKVTNTDIVDKVYEMDLCPECHDSLITWVFNEQNIK